ncbi:DNA processing protein DprA [Clostridia bacterium]|nr:DNA processing protein DprA [Clostridia bacterium]
MKDDLDDLIYWIWFSQIAEIGRIKTSEVLLEYGSPRILFEQIKASSAPKRFFKLFPKLVESPGLGGAKAILKNCRENGCEIITYADSLYPERLRQIYSAPPLFYAKGNLDILNELEQNGAICVVGARGCVEYGVNVTRELTRGLAEAGVITISGFAIGIDAVVHEETLAVSGKTIAVLGCGIDVDYPQKNAELRKKMLQGNGLFLSEYPLQTKATKFSFPVRNRVMAGLSDGVLVTEANLISGSLITANRCLDQGKDVFSVPHNVGSPGSEGCNKLLKDGAFVVTEVNDILMELQNRYRDIELIAEKKKDSSVERLLGQNVEKSRDVGSIDLEDLIAGLSDGSKRVYSVLQSVPKELDFLVSELAMDLSDLLVSITELELLGLIKTHPGSLYSI